MTIPYFKQLDTRYRLMWTVGGWIVICALVWGVSLYSAQRLHDAKAFFEHALAKTGIVTVEWNGTAYRVDGGIVYREQELIDAPGSALPVLELAYKKVSADYSPILAIPGEDTAKLRIAIEKLAQTQNEIAVSQATPSSARAVDDLFPIPFLSALVGAEDARRSFIESGKDTDASRYDDALRSALAAYESSLSRFRRSLVSTVSDTSTVYAASDAIVSKQTIVSALSQLHDALLAARSHIRSRTDCVRGIIHACDTADLSYPTIILPPPVKVGPAALSTTHEIQRLLASAYKDPQVENAPLVALSDSVCASGVPGKPIFTMYTGVVGGEPLLTPLPLGDIRLFRIGSSSTPFLQYFTSHGVMYLWHSPFTHYKCLRIQSDTSKIIAVIAVRALIGESPLSEYAKDAATVSALRGLEQTIVGGAVLQEADAIRYLSLAKNLRGSLPGNIAERIITLTLQFKYNTGGLEDTVRKIAVGEHANQTLSLGGVPTDPSAPRLFFSDSGFIPLFLGDNGSLIGTARELMPPNTLSPTNEPYVYYSTMPQTLSGSQTLIHDIMFFNDLYANLLPPF
ncbi:hypothetical protein HY971_02090 [Candidatus Kaiserbacteria bacterium]|nr:hypothetical protein [Candidatus Kaiserbacteria bacterium]